MTSSYGSSRREQICGVPQGVKNALTCGYRADFRADRRVLHGEQIASRFEQTASARTQKRRSAHLLLSRREQIAPHRGEQADEQTPPIRGLLGLLTEGRHRRGLLDTTEPNQSTGAPAMASDAPKAAHA